MPRDGRTLPHNILEETRFRANRSVPSRERCRGDREAAGCTIGAVYHVGLQNGGEMDSRLLRNATRQAGRPNWIVSDTAKRF
jgi:hypothetical protein